MLQLGFSYMEHQKVKYYNVNYNFRNIFVHHQPVPLISQLNVWCFSASNKINVAAAIRCPNNQNTPRHRLKKIKFGKFLGGGAKVKF